MAPGMVAHRAVTSSGTGSSEKYAPKQGATSTLGSVHHQIIVNGFHHKANAAIMSGHNTHTGTSTSGARVPANVGRPKSNGGSHVKASEHMTVVKSKNSTSGSLHGMIGGLMTSGGQSFSGTDSQLRGSNQRKK